MKKTVSVILSILVVLSCVFSLNLTVFAESIDNNLNVLEYEVLEDDTIKITRYDSMSSAYDIPSEINGKKVTVIGKKAFYECHLLKNVTIPDTVTTIENSAFANCEKLNTVVLGNSVKSIGYRSFADCDVLTTINFPNSLTSIGNNAFIRCFDLENITIPDSVTSIGNYAFSDCTGVKSITIGNGEVTIGEYAFGWCLSATDITLGKNVKELKNYAFYACDNATKFTIESEDCIIYDSINTLPEKATIYAYKDSSAYAYATKFEKELVALEMPFEKLIGDTDLDGKVTILDATAIQCYLAETLELSENALINADADEDSNVTVIDATKIQRIIAQLE